MFVLGEEEVHQISVSNETEFSRMGKQSVLFTNDNDSKLVKFSNIHGKNDGDRVKKNVQLYIYSLII